jgi:hypothetical protein
MDFVYRPEIAALIADWVWYISPVPAAKRIVAKDLNDPKVARSELVFPDESILGAAGGSLSAGAPLRYYPRLATAEEREAWTRTFAPIVT